MVAQILATRLISYYNSFMPQKYDPNIHHRRSIRLPGCDYSQDGWYFVTICAQERQYIFGDIKNNGQVRLNNAGRMIETWWRGLTNKFSRIRIDEYVVMPNHFHGIVIIVGAARCGRPEPDGANDKSGQPHRVAPTLGDIVHWFKTMTTNQYIRGVKQNGWPPFPGRLWQRNYYEHIIRNEDELNHFRQYITDNPSNWQTDEENPDVTS